MTSCFVHYDIIFYPFPVNSQYLKKSGINSPALDSVFHPEEVVSQPKLKQALSLEQKWASVWLLNFSAHYFLLKATDLYFTGHL